MSRPDRPGDLVFIGDVHLQRDGPDLDAFLSFLEQLPETASRVVLIGDLFHVWIGRRELEQPHQRVVIDRLERLRREGLTIRYVEGNRDYRIGPTYCGSAFDEAGQRGIIERFGGLSLFAIHGDMANPADRRYRTWRRISRGGLVWWVFNLLPAGRRRRLAATLDARLDTTNLEHKQQLPEEAVRRYAATFLSRGHDAVVLGHFHVERALDACPPSPPGRIFVLPEWKGSRRHLRVSGRGEIAFVDSSD